MKNLIKLLVLSTILAGHAFAQNRDDDRKDNEATKSIVRISKQEWKDAMTKYETDLNQYRKVTTEVEFLKYKTTIFDSSIKEAEDRRAPYEASLSDPTESVRVEAKVHLERLNKKIAELKAEKAKAEVIAKEAEEDAKGTYKPVDQIEAELAATKTTISTRLAPFKATGDKADPLIYTFLQQDLKYDGEKKHQIEDESHYFAKKYLNKKYPPSGLFSSEVTNFYDQRRSLSKVNKEKSDGTMEKTDSSLPPAFVQHKGKTTITQQLVSRGPKKDDTQVLEVKTDTSVVTPVPLSKDPATNQKMVEFNKKHEVQTADSTRTHEEGVDEKFSTAGDSLKMAEYQKASGGDQKKQACEDDALKAIYKALSSDKNNAFAKMYELTVMRLARKTLTEGSATLEGYTKSKITDLEGYFNKVKDAGEVQNKVKEAYELYGKSGDLEVINKDLAATLERGKKSCYWSSSTRLYNEHAAAYVLAMSATDSSSGLTDGDAATIWAVEKIRAQGEASGKVSYRQGQENGNLMNVSNRVARYLGQIQGGKGMSKSDLDQAIVAQEQELSKVVADSYGAVKGALHDCINKIDPSKPCSADYDKTFSDSNLGIASIQKGLASSVKKSENLEMTSKLKGKIGDISFDLNNFAKDSVIKDPARVSKFDSCGQARSPATSSKGPAKIKEASNQPFKVKNGQLNLKERYQVTDLSELEQVCLVAGESPCSKPAWVYTNSVSESKTDHPMKIYPISMKSCLPPNYACRGSKDTCCGSDQRVIYQQVK